MATYNGKSGLMWSVGIFLCCTLGAHAQSSSTGKTPLSQLGVNLYNGFPGGLYPNGQNAPPPVHLTNAMAAAAQIVPRNGTGAPDPNGWIVFLSVGMSNACHEFSVFERQEDMNVNRNARVIIINGAVGGQTASIIADPTSSYWQTVLSRLTAMNLTPAQVQVIWMKEANSQPPNDFPGHALQLKSDLRSDVQVIHDNFPNARLCYMSSRIYGGYATPSSINPEPQAYEEGFSFKWLIEDQINGIDPGLNYGAQPGTVESPLLLWGPYLWADGIIPRNDGLVWLSSDLEMDSTHPSPSGEQKVANLLSQFFVSESTAQPWYAAQPGVTLVTFDAIADAYVQQSTPTTNFGTDLELRNQGGATPVRSYMKFDTSSVGSPVLFAKLNLRVTTNGLGGGTVSFANDSSWGETTITFSNAPSIVGNTVTSIPGATRDGTITGDVTSVVNADADGVITLALSTTDAGLRNYDSREFGQPPRLTIVKASPQVPVISPIGLGLLGVVMVGIASRVIAHRQHAVR